MSGMLTYHNYSLSQIPDLDGKVAVITQLNYHVLTHHKCSEISTQCLLHGIKKLYIVARSQVKYDGAVDAWRRDPRIKLGEWNTEAEGDEMWKSRTEFIPCDLGDMLQVRRAAGEIKRRTDRLDILFCNAGLPIIPAHTLSPQSIETIFASNYVGHYILTTLLLPLLKSTIAHSPHPHSPATNARVVVTSSSLHHLCRELNLDLVTSKDPIKSRCYDGIWRYARSKLANILFTRELARRRDDVDDDATKHIYANSFFPGNIATEQMDIWKQYLGGILGRLVKWYFALAGQSTRDGAATAMYLGASGDVIGMEGIKGEYFIPIARKGSTSGIGNDMELAKTLWDWTDNKVTEVMGNGWQKI
ncbi:hypothetical protein AJ79_02828 [Helicocarpus griseus UAMH5409]|uniref:Short-chain dehydrogenase n=1 Tax=Helicocarpus griseus UAMH5409 TaxID=1447875 RepID=A0A2B7Y1T1_9EURO|nr:hypothetical protein AJ79_02828 [Helicocarpus griseus UAMH5409]